MRCDFCNKNYPESQLWQSGGGVMVCRKCNPEGFAAPKRSTTRHQHSRHLKGGSKTSVRTHAMGVNPRQRKMLANVIDYATHTDQVEDIEGGKYDNPKDRGFLLEYAKKLRH